MKRSSSTRSRSGAAKRQASTAGRTPSRATAGSRATRSTSSKQPTPRRAAKSGGRAKRAASRTSIPWPVYVAGVLAFALWSFYPAAQVEYREQREKARLEAQLLQLKERNSTLREQVDRLKTPEGVEDVARRSLGYVAPGEHAYVVESSNEATVQVKADEPEQPESSLGQRILDFVFAVR